VRRDSAGGHGCGSRIGRPCATAGESSASPAARSVAWERGRRDPLTCMTAASSHPYMHGRRSTVSATCPCDSGIRHSLVCSPRDDDLRDLAAYPQRAQRCARVADGFERKLLGQLMLCARMAAGGETRLHRAFESSAMQNSDYTVVEKLQERHIHELHALYQGEWWTRGRNLNDVRRVIEGSQYVFGLCTNPGEQLVAFARVLTDRAFKALIFDVIVAPGVRGEGLGRQLMERIVGHPDLKDVKHLELYCLPEMVTFYEKWGFSTNVSGVTFMRRRCNREHR
jgi:GNAT superfamily N-acetyltransferase